MIRFVLYCFLGLFPHAVAAQDVTPQTHPTFYVLFDSSGSAYSNSGWSSSPNYSEPSKPGARDFFWAGVKLALEDEHVISKLVSCQYNLRALAWSDKAPRMLSSERARSTIDVARFVEKTGDQMSATSINFGHGTAPATVLDEVTREMAQDENMVPVVVLLYDGSGYTQSTFDIGLRDEIARRGGSIHLIGYPFFIGSNITDLARDIATPSDGAVIEQPMYAEDYPGIIARMLQFDCRAPGV